MNKSEEARMQMFYEKLCKIFGADPNGSTHITFENKLTTMSKIEKYLEQYAPEAWTQMQEHFGKPTIDQLVKAIMGYAIVTAANSNKIEWPTDKQLIDFAILFNEGVLDKEKIADMVGYATLMLDRLKENGDVLTPSSKEEDDLDIYEPPG